MADPCFAFAYSVSCVISGIGEKNLRKQGKPIFEFEIDLHDGVEKITARTVEKFYDFEAAWLSGFVKRWPSTKGWEKVLYEIDGKRDFMLSGGKSKAACKCYCRQEAEKLHLLLSHVRRLCQRAENSRSVKIMQLKSLYRNTYRATMTVPDFETDTSSQRSHISLAMPDFVPDSPSCGSIVEIDSDSTADEGTTSWFEPDADDQTINSVPAEFAAPMKKDTASEWLKKTPAATDRVPEDFSDGDLDDAVSPGPPIAALSPGPPIPAPKSMAATLETLRCNPPVDGQAHKALVHENKKKDNQKKKDKQSKDTSCKKKIAPKAKATNKTKKKNKVARPPTAADAKAKGANKHTTTVEKPLKLSGAAKKIWSACSTKDLDPTAMDTTVKMTKFFERGHHVVQIRRVDGKAYAVTQIADKKGTRNVRDMEAGAYVLAELLYFGVGKDEIETVKNSKLFLSQILNE